MKKLISLALALTLIIACLGTLSFAADTTLAAEPGKPIVKVTTGTTVTECKTVEEMLAAVDASGKSVITVLQDFSYTANSTMTLPYSCTIDFGGHTVSGSKDEKVDAFTVAAVGSENNITTLKNGTLLFGRRGLNIKGGGFTVSGMVIYGPVGEPISPVDASFKGDSLIENSTLIAGDWGGMSFNSAGDHSNHHVTIKDSTLATLNPGGCVLLDVDSKVTAGGKITLGTGVKMYGCRIVSFASAMNKLDGETATKNAATQTFEVPELEIKMANMTLFETAPTPAPVVPETPAAPATPVAPTTPAVPEAPVPTTGVSIVGLSILAAVSAAGAAFVARKKEN